MKEKLLSPSQQSRADQNLICAKCLQAGLESESGRGLRDACLRQVWSRREAFLAVVVCRSRFSGETEPLGPTEMRESRFIMGTAARNVGGWGRPGCAFCKLENEENVV